MLNRKTVADLYLNLLVPWEATYKKLPAKGSFDIRSKEFTAYKRENNFEFEVFETKLESDKAIKANASFGSEAKQMAVFQKGDNSRARSLFKHLRNSVAHAHVERVKIKNKWFLIFTATGADSGSGVTHLLLRVQIQESKLGDLIAALKSTAKSV